MRCCHREKNRIEAVSSAVLAASTSRRLGVNMANQMKKRVHAAKVRAADKTTLIVHPNVREEIPRDYVSESGSATTVSPNLSRSSPENVCADSE